MKATAASEIRTGDIIMKYLRFGTRGARPLVILPGVSVKSTLDAPNAIPRKYSAFAGDHDVFYIDRRINLPDRYSYIEMTDDTAAVMDALGISGADVYGMSQGGMIAQVMAIRRPDLIGRMALISTSPSIDNEMSKNTVGKWIKLAEEKKREELMAEFASDIYTVEFASRYRKAFLYFSQSFTDEDLRRFTIICSNIGQFDIRDQLCEIRCPVLVIAAEGDRMFGTEPSRAIAEAVHGELCIFPGHSHAIYDETDECQKRAAEFFLKAGE